MQDADGPQTVICVKCSLPALIRARNGKDYCDIHAGKYPNDRILWYYWPIGRSDRYRVVKNSYQAGYGDDVEAYLDRHD